MDFMIWNSRGLYSTKKVDFINSHCLASKISLFALLEPKHDGKDIILLNSKIRFSNYMHFSPTNIHIWLFWNDNVFINILNIHQQHVTMKIFDGVNYFHLSIVYASTDMHVRKDLWDALGSLNLKKDLWVVGGDFNAVSSNEEKLGGLPYSIADVADFNQFINCNALCDPGFIGDKFTWCNGRKGNKRIWSRLDRVLVSRNFSNVFPNFQVSISKRLWSDHSALIFNFLSMIKPIFNFKFCSRWSKDAKFCSDIKHLWVNSNSDVPFSSFFNNIKKVRSFARDFGFKDKISRDLNIKNLEKTIFNIDLKLRVNWDEKDANDLDNAKQNLSNLMDAKYSYIRDKARVNWLVGGDRNSKFFHACIKERTHYSKWNFILDDGSYTSDPSIIGPLALIILTIYLLLVSRNSTLIVWTFFLRMFLVRSILL